MAFFKRQLAHVWIVCVCWLCVGESIEYCHRVHAFDLVGHKCTLCFTAHLTHSIVSLSASRQNRVAAALWGRTNCAKQQKQKRNRYRMAHCSGSSNNDDPTNVRYVTRCTMHSQQSEHNNTKFLLSFFLFLVSCLMKLLMMNIQYGKCAGVFAAAVTAADIYIRVNCSPGTTQSLHKTYRGGRCDRYLRVLFWNWGREIAIPGALLYRSLSLFHCYCIWSLWKYAMAEWMCDAIHLFICLCSFIHCSRTGHILLFRWMQTRTIEWSAHKVIDTQHT